MAAVTSTPACRTWVQLGPWSVGGHVLSFELVGPSVAHALQ